MDGRAYTEQDEAGCLALAQARGFVTADLEAALRQGRWWVLDHEGTIVGAGGLLERNDVDELVWGMVDPRHERQGLGRYLLMLRQRHSRAPRLEANVPQEYLAFWEKNGFRPVSSNGGLVRVGRKMAVCP